jgi:ubiquitin-conjugating enzyme E2 Q
VDDDDEPAFGDSQGEKAWSDEFASGCLATDVITKRAREDLLAAREAGFKVGVLSSQMHGKRLYVSLSCRIAKLGISDEAMLAWHLEGNQYLIFLIQYSSGYKTVENIAEQDTSLSRLSIEFRIGVSNSYKPSLVEAIDAFTTSSRGKVKMHSSPNGPPNGTTVDDNILGRSSGLSEIFIGKPLIHLLNEKFLMLLKTRVTSGLSWNGAESYINDIQVSVHLNPAQWFLWHPLS